MVAVKYSFDFSGAGENKDISEGDYGLLELVGR